MIGSVLALIQTLFDIVRLKKGPEAIPRSSVVFVMVVGLWLAAEFAAQILLVERSSENVSVSFAISLSSLVIYALVTAFYGRSERIPQMLTAVVGCNALLMFIVIAIRVFAGPALGVGPVGLLIWLILFWFVSVEGHILARTLSQPPFVGLAIAVAVFVLQIYLTLTFFPPEPPVS